MVEMATCLRIKVFALSTEFFYCFVLFLVLSGSLIFPEEAIGDLGFSKVSETFEDTFGSLRENLTLTSLPSFSRLL